MKYFSIPEPCSENWNEMTSTEKGAFCQKCSNEVHDVSNMSNDEIILMLALPWFFRIWRLKTIIFIGLLCWGTRYGFFILGLDWQQEWLHMLAVAMHGAAYIFAMLSAQIYLDTRVPVHLRSTAQGFFTLLTVGLGTLVGAFIAGEAVSYHTLEGGLHNWRSIWQLPTWFGILTALFFWWQFKGKDKA